MKPRRLWHATTIDRRQTVRALAAKEPFSDLPGFENLSQFRRWLLFYRLIAARERLVEMKMYKATPPDTAAKLELANIEKSVKRIAKFWSDREFSPEIARALRVLIEAGDDVLATTIGGPIQWTKQEVLKGHTRDKETGEVLEWLSGEVIEHKQLALRPTVPYPLVGPAGFLRGFFESANAVHAALKAARHVRLKAAHSISPIRWLYGDRLPKIYSGAFGRKFSHWVTDTGEAEGIRFVCLAGAALGEKKISAQTARSHHRAESQPNLKKKAAIFAG